MSSELFANPAFEVLIHLGNENDNTYDVEHRFEQRPDASLLRELRLEAVEIFRQLYEQESEYCSICVSYVPEPPA